MKQRAEFLGYALWYFAMAASLYYLESFGTEGNMKTPLRHVPKRVAPGFQCMALAFRWR